MQIHQLAVDEALLSLHSGFDGLADDEAARRLQEFGSNQVEKVASSRLGERFLKSFAHFFALILWFAAGLAFVAEWYDPGQGMRTLGLAILAVILINGVFSFWQEYRADRAIAALQKLLPHQVKLVRGGTVRQAPVEELAPGDVILLEAGDDVPADCRVIQAFGAQVNNATVTGESLPLARDASPSTEEETLHGANVLLAGTSLVSGQVRALVFATGRHTEFGRIARLTQAGREALSPLQKEIARLSRLIAVFSLALGFAFFVIGRALGLSFWDNALFAIGVIVANVPEGLLPTVTLALALGSQRMARRNALIRHLPSVETLGSASVICTDKTGTLTQNRMAVKSVFLCGALHPPTEAGPAAHTDARRRLFEAAYLCHTLKEVECHGKRTVLGDPMEVALVEMAAHALPESPSCPRVDEISFDSDRKRLSTLHRSADGLVLYSKGALEALLPLCGQVQWENEVRPLAAEDRERFLQAQESLAKDGLRVLAFAYRRVAEGTERGRLEESLILSGLVGLEDPVRPEVPGAIEKCRTAGIKVIMVTGDHPRTALAVARQIGLATTDRAVVITGERLRRMSDTQLQLALSAPEILFARVGPEQKMRIVRALKAKRLVVAATGDGVNDAPALREADIGIAMGLTGTDVARAAADMVLMDDNFASIVAAVEEGRAVFENMKKFLTYILTHNVAELVPYLAFVLARVPLPLTVMQILAVDLGTDTLPALALGAEPPDPQTMKKPPRSASQRLLSWGLLARAYLVLGPLEALAAMAAYFFALFAGGWRYNESLLPNNLLYLQATTACLTAIIVMQVGNVFLCRGERASVFSFVLFGNRLLLWGVLAELALILAIDYTPLGNWVFGTAPISGTVWLFLVPFLFGMIAVEEIRKWLVRSAPNRGRPRAVSHTPAVKTAQGLAACIHKRRSRPFDHRSAGSV